MPRAYCGRLAAALLFTTAIGPAVMFASPAHAQSAVRAFDIPAQPLSSAILEFARQGDVLVVADPNLTRGRTSRPLKGSFVVGDALRKLLEGTDVRAAAVPTGGYRLEALGAGAQAVGPARTSMTAARGEGPSELSEVIVTAARRPQRLLDTSLAVSAIGEERLAAANVSTTADLQTMVPTLQYAVNPGQNFVYVRGIGNNIFGAFSNNSVATYVDGVYVPRQSGAIQELFDVNGVEVLRGPQATLYGRNATGGAILITSAPPTDAFEASADAQYGNYDEQKYKATVSGPLLGETLAGRLSVIRHTDEGDNTNLLDGSKFNAQDFWAGRATLRFRPTQRLELTLIGNYSLEDGSLGASKAVDRDSFAFRPFLQGGLGQPFSADPRKSYHNVKNVRRQEIYGGLLRVNWDLDFATLTSVTSYNRYENGPNASDTDDVGAPLLEFIRQVEKTDFYTQDVLLTSKGDGPFEWLGGFTALREETETLNVVRSIGGTVVLVGDTAVNGYAVFVQAAYNVTSQIKAEAGVRYSRETREGVSQRSFEPAILNKKTWEDTSPRFVLNYKPGPNALFYVSATRGFKSGAFDAQDASNAVRPETIWSYEVGAHMQPAAGLTVNLTAFRYDYKDIQLFSGRLVNGFFANVLQNAAQADVDGVEAEVDWRFGDGWNLGGALSWLNARYADWTILDDSSNAAFGAPAPRKDVSGNRLVMAPEWSGSLYVRKRLDLGDAGGLELYGDLFYQSKRYFTPFEDQTLSAKASTTFNGRVTYSPVSERFYVGAFVRNASDELIPAFASRTQPFSRAFNYGPGRRYGVVAGVRY